MRYLGIDFGSKRVGIALSDEGGAMAFPHSVMKNSPMLLDDIAVLCEGEQVGLVVIGESKDFSGKRNAIQDAIDVFVTEWKSRSDIPIALEPEFLTSHQAHHIQGKSAMLDASAATIILQSYIDRQK